MCLALEFELRGEHHSSFRDKFYQGSQIMHKTICFIKVTKMLRRRMLYRLDKKQDLLINCSSKKMSKKL